MRSLLALLIIFSALLGAGCASKIEGETSTPPPAGGPKASADHPPGENPAVLSQEKK